MTSDVSRQEDNFPENNRKKERGGGSLPWTSHYNNDISHYLIDKQKRFHEYRWWRSFSTFLKRLKMSEKVKRTEEGGGFASHLQLQLQQPRPPRGTAIRLAAMRQWQRPWQQWPRSPPHRCYPTWNLGWNSGWNSGWSQERRSTRVPGLPREWQGGPVGPPLQVLRNAPGSHRLPPWPCSNLTTTGPSQMHFYSRWRD